MLNFVYGAALILLSIDTVHALDNCASDVLVKAYEGLNVSTQLVSCMTKNNFSAALDGSVDLTNVNSKTAPSLIKTICASDSCQTVLSVLVTSSNFNVTNCIVGSKLVLMNGISNLHSTCVALSSSDLPSSTSDSGSGSMEDSPQNTTQAPTYGSTSNSPPETPYNATQAPTTPSPETHSPTPLPPVSTPAPHSETPSPPNQPPVTPSSNGSGNTAPPSPTPGVRKPAPSGKQCAVTL